MWLAVRRIVGRRRQAAAVPEESPLRNRTARLHGCLVRVGMSPFGCKHDFFTIGQYTTTGRSPERVSRYLMTSFESIANACRAAVKSFAFCNDAALCAMDGIFYYVLPKLPAKISAITCCRPRRLERKFLSRSSHRNHVRYAAPGSSFNRRIGWRSVSSLLSVEGMNG